VLLGYDLLNRLILIGRSVREAKIMSLTILAEPVPLVVNTDGVVLIGKTRVTLDTIIEAFEAGATAEEINQQFPTVDLADIYAAISYYLKHETEVARYLKVRAELAQTVRAENEQRFPSQGLRDRLLARRAAQQSQLNQ
jgi:uncharacterized protein (DUF433 family)